MPGPDAVLFTHYQYDPEVGGFIEPDQSSEFAYSLHELSGGRLVQQGSAIIDVETHRIIGNVATKSGASIDVGTDGTILLNNNVSKSGLRAAMGTNAIPRAIIEGDLAALGGAFPENINRTVTLAPQGQVIYVDETKLPGKGAYNRVNMAVFGEGGPPLSNSLGTLITPEQMLIRGVAGWLSRNAPGAIDRLKLQGVQMPDGTTSISGSDIVRAIAANIAVQPVVTRVLSEGNQVARGVA